MKEVVLVFRSRSDAFAFQRYLQGRGVQSTIINTPRQITRACGLSLKTYGTPEAIRILVAQAPIGGVSGGYVWNGQIYQAVL